MSSTWNDPDREPTPPDPDLDALARLYRDHPPPPPTEQAWRETFSRAAGRLARRPNQPRRWPFLLGVVGAAAAALGGVVLARSLWPTTTTAADREGPAVAAVNAAEDEPFPVAALSEIEIIRMDPNDADRVVLGAPLMGTMEFVSPDDVDLVRIDPDPEAGHRAFLRRDPGVPMIMVADAKGNANINADADFDDQP